MCTRLTGAAVTGRIAQHINSQWTGIEASTRWFDRIRSSEMPEDDLLGPGVYFPYLRGSSTVAQSLEVRFPRSGSYRQEHFALRSRFPFGFLEKVLKVPAHREFLVYPAVEPTEEFYEILPLLSGELESFYRGRGHDLYSIRDYQPGDSARVVDWKASAHTSALKVREFTREDERRVQLVFDRSLPDVRPPGRPPDGKTLERFERAVDFCAALGWHFYQIDSQVEFVSDDFRTRSGPAAEVIFDILSYLARVEPRGASANLLETLGDGDLFKIILTAATPGSIPTHLWTCSYLVFQEKL